MFALKTKMPDEPKYEYAEDRADEKPYGCQAETNACQHGRSRDIEWKDHMYLLELFSTTIIPG